MSLNDRQIVGCELMYPGSCRSYLRHLELDEVLADIVDAMEVTEPGERSGGRVLDVVDWLKSEGRWSEDHHDAIRRLVVAHMDLPIDVLAQVIERSSVAS